MGILSGWFGPKFDDQRLVTLAQTAISADPLIREPGDLTLHSKKGIVTLDGIVHRTSEKDRIEGVVHSALKTTGIKYERVQNNLRVVTPASASSS
jgi:osmotically-inducible protein OsmY